MRIIDETPPLATAVGGPGCWVKQGRSGILVLDVDGGVEKPVAQGLAKPILDEVREESVAGFRYLPRASQAKSTPGRIKAYRVYVGPDPFPGL